MAADILEQVAQDKGYPPRQCSLTPAQEDLFGGTSPAGLQSAKQASMSKMGSIRLKDTLMLAHMMGPQASKVNLIRSSTSGGGGRTRGGNKSHDQSGCAEFLGQKQSQRDPAADGLACIKSKLLHLQAQMRMYGRNLS